MPPSRSINNFIKPPVSSFRTFKTSSSTLSLSILRLRSVFTGFLQQPSSSSSSPLGFTASVPNSISTSTSTPTSTSSTVTATTTTFAAAAVASILSFNTLVSSNNSARNSGSKKFAAHKWLKKRNFSSIMSDKQLPGPVSPSLKVPEGAEVATFGAG